MRQHSVAGELARNHQPRRMRRVSAGIRAIGRRPALSSAAMAPPPSLSVRILGCSLVAAALACSSGPRAAAPPPAAGSPPAESKPGAEAGTPDQVFEGFAQRFLDGYLQRQP